MKQILKSIENINSHRIKLIEYLNKHELSKRKKEKLFGWGLNNYNKRLKYIKNADLIKAVEKLLYL